MKITRKMFVAAVSTGILVAAMIFVSPIQAADPSLVGLWKMDNNWNDSAGTNHGNPVGGDQTPQMTSDTAPAPYAVTANSSGAPYYNPYKAFDHTSSYYGQWVTYTTSGWITFDFGSGNTKKVSSYKIKGPDGYNAYTTSAPKNWTFEGSNDNSVWTILHTVTGQTGWAAGEERLFKPSLTGNFRYYRLNISANNGYTGYTAVDEIKLLSEPGFSTNAKSGSHAGSFDGLNDYVSVTHLALANSTAFTIEGWFKATTGTGYIYAEGNAGGSYLPVIGIYTYSSDNKLHAYIRNDAGTTLDLNSGITVMDGSWHHFAFVQLSKSNRKLYVDGIERSSNTVNIGTVTTNNSKIGALYYSNPPTVLSNYNGLIDEVAIYNRAFSAEEIKAHYDAATVSQPTVDSVPPQVTSPTINISGTKPTNASIFINGVEVVPIDSSTTWQTTYVLQSYTNILNVTSKNANGYSSDSVVVNVTYTNAPVAVWYMDGNWHDSSGNGYDGTAYNGATFSTNAKAGTRAGSFDGVDDYVTVPNLNITGPISVEAWVKFSNINKAQYIVYGEGQYVLWLMSDNHARFADSQGSGINSATIIEAGRWYHIVGVFSGTAGEILTADNAKIYINGVSDGSVISGTWSPVSLNYVHVGHTSFDGLLDYVATYKRVLSAPEILEHYQNGLVAQPSVTPMPPPTTAIQTITVSGTKPANTSIVINGTEVAPLDASTNWQGTYKLAAGLNGLNVTAKNSLGFHSEPVKINVTYLTPPVALWHMDNDNWIDSSGNGYNGTAYSGAAFSSSSKVGTHAGSFDGANSYIGLPQVFRGHDFSVEFWVKRQNGAGYTWPWIISNNVWTGFIAHGLNSGGNFWCGAGGNAFTASNDANFLPDGQWVHVVYTRSDKQRLYRNGALYQEANDAPNGWTSTTTISAPGSAWKGLIDELAIYDRAITASEVLEHYQRVYVAPPSVTSNVPAVTSSPVLALSGTRQTNTAVLINGVTVAPLDISTSWQGTYTLQSGSNTLSVIAMDTNGNRSQTVTITVALDNTAPTISSSIPSNNAFVNMPVTSVTINLADAYSTINLDLTKNNATVKNSSGQDIPGTWTTSGANSVIFTPNISLNEGTYTATIYPTDSFGNTGTGQITFNYDATAPPAPAINSVVTPTNISAQLISGTKSSDATSITISTTPVLSVGTVTYASSTSWSVLVSGLKEGSNTIAASAKDAAGNSSGPVSSTIVYDITPPAKPTVNDFTSTVKDTSITLMGVKDADTSLWLNNVKIIDLNSLTSWQTTYTLKSGSNTLSFTSVDAAGNVSSANIVTVILDDKPPVIETSLPANNSDTSKTVNSISIDLIDTYSAVKLAESWADATVKNSAGQTISGSWTTSGTKTIIVTPLNTLPEDTYTVTIYPVDALNNKGQQQITFTNHDITPPVTNISLSGTKGNDNWYSTSVTVTLTADDGANGIGVDKIEYSLDNKTWNIYSAPFVLDKDGVNTLYYKTTDKAGNVEFSSSKKNIAVSSNGGVASATSKLKDISGSCDGSPYFANDGQAVQVYSPPGCGDGGTWLGAYASGDTWMVKFSGQRNISEMRWMAWTQSGWNDAYSQPKNYYVEYTTDAAPTINGGSWLPVSNMAVTNTNGTVTQSSAYVSGNTNGNWLTDITHKWIIHNFTPVNATALRIRVVAKVGGTSYGAALGEVEVYESEKMPKSADIKINKTGIIGQWHMDESWQDSSVPGNHGTSVGAVFSSSAKIGSHSGSFDGVNDYVSIPDNNLWAFGSYPFTIELWAKFNSTGNAILIGNDEGGGTRNKWILGKMDGFLTFHINSPSFGAVYPVSYAWSPNIGQWYQIALTRSGNTYALYIDGTSVQTKTDSTVIPNASAPLTIGQSEGLYYMNGLIDEVTIYDHALSATEIRDKYLAASIAVPTIDLSRLTSPTALQSITIYGTKPAGTSVLVNGAEVYSWDGGTDWQGTVSLLPGVNKLYVTAKDVAGYQSQAVSVNVIRDITAPTISSSVPANGAVVNQVAAIDIILLDDYSTVKLEESKLGATVKNPSGIVLAGTWLVQGSHIVFTPATQLTEGIYTVTIYPVDALENRGTASFGFTVEMTSPLVQSLAMSPTSPHKAEPVTFTVTFNEDMTTTQQPVVTFTRGASYPTYTITGSWASARTWSGAYTFTSGTGDGTYTVSVSSAKDKAGNIMNPQNAGTFVLDTSSAQPPVITSPQGSLLTKIPNQTISGTKPADTAIIINGIERVSLNSSTSWSYTYPLSEGQNNISVTARDAAGNDSSAATTTIILDTTPPAFNINTYKNPSPTPTQTLTGTKEAGCIVKLNGVTIFDSTDQNTSWSHTVTLTEGIASHFVFTASDALGNTITKAIDILYDASAPSQLGPGVLVADGSGKGTEITLSWGAYIETPDIAYYKIYMSSTNFTDTTGMTPIGTTNKGVKTFKVTGLTQGSTYYFAVVPVDISGNFNPLVNTAVGIPRDTAAPEDVAITSVTAGYDIISGNLITISWTPSANSKGDLADQGVYFDDGRGYDTGTSIGKIITTYTKTGLNDATKYKFKITVKDSLAHESNGVITEGVTRLPNPATLSATPGNAKITLSWSAVSSPYVKQYNIYRLISDVQQKDVKTMLLIKTVSSSTYTYTDTGLANGTDYQYAVTTLNTYGAERTDVLSITARPRMDTTGPVISGFSITQGQVITAPITISASAADSESSMAKIELYIDGTLVKTQTGGSISYFWNVVATTDGNHTIKLIVCDQYGNLTEETRQVVVSLAPPSTPSITGHPVTQTTPKYLVNVTGTTPLYTTVILRVNGVVVTQMPSSDTGTFSFASVELKEGDNFLAVKASHRGGESQYSSDLKIAVDTGAPPSPVNLTAQVLTGGAVRLSWQNAIGEIPSGYNLYMSTSSFTSKNDAGVAKVNTSPILYLFNDYTPPSDSLRYYAVTSVDSADRAGNESGISNVVSTSSDRVAPFVSSIKYRYKDPAGIETYPASIAGPGSVKVELTVNEPLKEMPFLSLEPSSGSPIIITLTKISDTLYEGSFSVTSLIESGPTTYKFSGKDMTGNRGTAQGAGITIDASGPVAAIQSPLTVLQIKTEPATVNIAFNEPSITIPVMELRSSSGLTAGITGLVSSDNGVHWTGTIDISALPEGNAEFMLKEAKDKLGNIGTTVSSGKNILIYRDSVPPPDTPTGLTAKTEKGGIITLTWNPIGSASSYNLYRRAQNETTPVKIKTGILGSPSQDLPPADGVYYYSVTSVGLLQSESAKSSEAGALSDRTGPPAPVNLGLSLDSTGVVAVWSIQGTEIPKAYNLYRSSGPITTTSGLTPVIKVGITKAVDVSPSRVYRFYAVTAFDSLGNEGPLSETKEINFPVSPVRDLVLEKIDDAAPRITWQAPFDGDTIGYHIYRNGQRITSYPVTALSYTDGYYSGGNVTYGISAVNNLGVEGPIKEVTLPELSIGIKQGTVLRRGLLETVPVVISSNTNLTIDSISIKVGTASSSSLEGPFTLLASSTLQVEKVTATTADAPSVVAVITGASWSPTPGATVRITKTLSAEVIGSSTALEIFSDPLIRGTDGKIRLKVNNIGTALMEFLTSENSGVTTKVKITLKDEDGNVLSTGYLDQRVGNSILNTGSYAVARLNPNENIITDPITINVPQSAPYKVIIEAKIENTYYHYGKTDQVTAPGMTQFIATTISETAYRAYASPEKTFYPYAQPVLITGQAISNPSNQPMPYVPVKLGISIKGFDRFFIVTTDANGNFTYTFTPGSNEAGLYTIWAVHPDIKDRAVQATFAIAGLSITPSYANVRMTRGRSLDIPVSLYNYGGASLIGLTLETSAGPGITAGVINNGDNILISGENAGITVRLTASSNAPDTSYAALVVRTNEGVNTRLDASISLVSSIPIITTSPSYIDTGMVRGNQKIDTFTITNVGEETLRNARIEGPSTSWMSLTTNRAIGDIKPGTSTSIGILFRPTDTVAQGVYNDRVVIYSDNHIPYTYQIQVTVTSNAVGNVMFDVLNELMQDVPNASITIQHQTLTELIYSLRTAADGTVMLYDIPEGRYSFNISATGHKSYSGTFVISPGITTTVPVALEVTLVQVEWSVTPIVIQDRYEIIITQTFETNVPTPVLVIEPAGITVPELASGQVFNGEFRVSNYGLIALNNVSIQYPTSFGEYNIELLATIPKTLNAMQKITVPYRITRRLTTASNQLSGFSSQYACNSGSEDLQSLTPNPLFDEVKGYGGTPCYASFSLTVNGDAVICPNTPQQSTVNRSAGYTFIIPIPGSNCSVSSGSAPIGGSSGGGGSYGSGGGTQGSGGSWLPGAQPVIIGSTDTNQCGDSDLPRCTDDNCCDVCTQSVVKMGSGTYEDGQVDIEAKTNGIPISFERYYTSRWTEIGKRPTQITFDSTGYKKDYIGFSTGGGGYGGSAFAVIEVKKVYNTSVKESLEPQPQSYGWTSPWFARIEGSAYFDGTGQAIYFIRQSDGSFTPTAGAERYVAEKGLKVIITPTGLQVRDKSGLRKNFELRAGTTASYRLASIEDEKGNKVTLNYDASDRLITISDVTGTPALTFTYAGNFITKIEDRDGRVVNYTVDSQGRLIEVNGPVGNKSKFEYDSIFDKRENKNFFRLLKKTDPENHITTIEYKPGELVVSKVTEPGGGSRSFTYDFPGRTFYYTDTRGITTTYTLNQDSKITSITKGGKQIKKIDYLDNRVEKVTDESGNTIEIQKNELYDPVRITDGEGNITRIEYNQYWKPAKITDPLGGITTFTYDSKQNLITITHPDGSMINLEYDAYGNVTKATRGEGPETSSYRYEYDTRGNLVKTIDPMGNITTYGYDQYGHPNKITDANGNATSVTNDVIGRPVTIQNPLGNTKTITYDKKGNATAITDEKGNITTYTYDFKGRVISQKDPKGTITGYTYDGEGNLTQTKEASGTSDERITQFGYDTLNRLLSLKDPIGNTTLYDYVGTAGCPSCTGGSDSLPSKITDPLGNITQMMFDKKGRVIGTKDPMGNLTGFAYNAIGKVISRTDANGNITRYQYDILGRIIKQTDANNGETIFTYDTKGNLKTLTDPNGNVTTFEYDSANRMIKEIRPTGQAIEYAYYPNGLLKTVKDAKGQITTYSYDSANRLKDITYADGKKDTFTYDAAGNMLTYAKDEISGTITYDELNRKLSETVNYGSFSKTYSYTYDNVSNKATFTSSGGKVYTYSYNKNNQPTTIAFDGKTINLNYQWDRLTKATLPNGVTTDYQYNANSWLNYINTKNATSGYLDKQYEFDKVGNITRKIDNATNITDYIYDPTYQLTKAVNPSLMEEFTYDKVGNRLTSQNSTQPSAISYTHNANNEMTSADPTAYSYDQNGNTIQEASGDQITKFIYNSSDRLEKVELPHGRIATYTYDPFGRRIKKDVNGDVTYYLYADEGLIGEYDSTGNLRKAYGWVPDSIWGTNPVFMLENNNYYFYHNDHLGTPQKITDISGNVVWSSTYNAFGEAIIDPASTVINNLRFPGQYFDEETGKHYNLQRYYNPKTGTYAQIDPIGFASGDINLFRYVFNNYVNITDPYGLQEVIEKYFAGIVKGNRTLNSIHAVVLHQTGASTAESTFSSYENSDYGAHYLIDKEGIIYKTAKLTSVTWHIGKIRSKCYQTKTCSKKEKCNIEKIYYKRGEDYQTRARNLHDNEAAKNYPDRYPINQDAIGIEFVSELNDSGQFVPITEKQQEAADYLINRLMTEFRLTPSDIYRHSDISYKNKSEAVSVKW